MTEVPADLGAAVERNLSLGATGIQVWRGGSLAAEAGNAAARANVRSVRKSFLSALYGVAIGDGLVDPGRTLAEMGIDDRGGLTEAEGRATIRDLLMARGGVYHPAAYESPTLARSHPPRGTHAPGEAPSERHARERGARHKKLTDWARQTLLQLPRWLPGRRIVAVADRSYAALDLLHAVRRRFCVVARLRLDARLFDPPPPRTPRTVGRPRVVGVRQPTLAQRLGRSDTPWRRLAVDGWYGGGGRRSVEAGTGTAVWHHTGLPVVPLRWVLVRDPQGLFQPQALLCTDLDVAPAEVLGWFVRRWAVEVTFAEARRHLGVETQRQWSDKAVARTTPALLGLFSLVALRACELHERGALTPGRAAWYRKEEPTFSDALAAVRRSLWVDAARFPTSRRDCDRVEVPRAVLNRLTDLACHAA